MPREPLAILTGASGDIGAAIAPRLAARGYRLLLCGRNRLALDQLARRLGPHHAVACPFDLAEPADTLAEHLQPHLEQHGPAHLLINNAGYNTSRCFLEQSADEHRELMHVNYLAAAELIRLVLPGMIARNAGMVINIASVAAIVGPWGHAGYAGAKAAMISLTETLAAEYAHTGVRFASLSPGIVRTGFFSAPASQPLWARVQRRAIQPGRVADQVVRLLERPRLARTVPRHYRVLELIKALCPPLAHRLVARQSRFASSPSQAGSAAPPAARQVH